MNKESLKAYLSNRYQGWKSFLDNVIFPIFGKDDFEDGYEAELLDSQPERKQLAETTGISSIKQVGMMYVGVEPLQIFDVTVSDRVMMERNRVNIQRLIRTVMDQFSCAFMLFHYEDDTRWDWRFTYCRKSGNREETTDSKRYTFLLGPGQSCRTATDNFMALYDKKASLEIKDIEEAFNVEALSKEFFGKYKAQYEAFVNYMVDPANEMRENFIDTDFDHTGMTADKIRDREEKPIRDYVKKLLGRIVFLHFIQKKGWLGVPADKEWGEGDRDFMLNLFKNATERQKNNFLDDILEDLFAEGLDRNRSDKDDLYDTEVEGFRNCRIPYLNGGLFERDNLDKKPSHFPASYFDDLLTMLSQYNFTIDENDPNDAEVGVDPEMLGRIFENLLEDNKDKGAFYTPKEIVQYMCCESLIAYLQTDQREEDKECIRQFVTTHDAEKLGDLKENIDQKLKDVKICDPAIGSGAFPMGLLRELFFCRSAIEPNIVENAANIKRHIIQNNIYGVDIERGAVDIARLRFWLSLIVDEKSPEALPNLDFKIMQGNSLLESYEGLDLSKLATPIRINEPQRNLFGELEDSQIKMVFTQPEKLKDFQKNLKLYFETTCHDERARIRKFINVYVKETIIYTLDTHRRSEKKKIEQIHMSSSLTDKQRKTIEETEEKIAHLNEVMRNVKDMELFNSQFFLWHTWFHDVFSRPSKEGFDIVIGNPPYIQLQSDGGKLAQLYEFDNYATFARTGDIYCLFYERGWQLLNKNGHLCYITSNKWMRAGYGESTRKFFANKTNPMLLIDFAGVKIFENATVDTNILLFAKSINQHKTVCAVTNKQNKDSVKNLSDFVQQQKCICDFSTSDSWVILSPIERSIKKKIESVGTPLKDWDINIYRGVLTGYNEAFIIDSEKRDEILVNCKTEDERNRTAELIRPILRGRDIKRNGYNWANLWLIYIPWHFPYQFDESIQGASEKAEKAFEKQYPAVYSHMLQYKEPLSKRNKEETGIRYEWYAMQRWGAKYWEDFSRPRIVYREIGEVMDACMVPPDVMINNKLYMVSGEHLEHLLRFFNSKLFNKTIFTKANLTGGKGIDFMEIVRVPLPSECDLSICKEQDVDNFLYSFYGLTQIETEYIENRED